MTSYTFKWKVKSGTGQVIRGHDIIELGNHSEEDFHEAVSQAIGSGDNYVFGILLGLCCEANTCDAGCEDWKIYKLKKVQK